jgi:hypothetical protein
MARQNFHVSTTVRAANINSIQHPFSAAPCDSSLQTSLSQDACLTRIDDSICAIVGNWLGYPCRVQGSHAKRCPAETQGPKTQHIVPDKRQQAHDDALSSHNIHVSTLNCNSTCWRFLQLPGKIHSPTFTATLAYRASTASAGHQHLLQRTTRSFSKITDMAGNNATVAQRYANLH